MIRIESEGLMSRQYKLHDPIGPGLTLNVHNDKDCILCKHCTCMWDYSNGPYMFMCDMQRPECYEAKSSEEHTCELFDENGEENA